MLRSVSITSRNIARVARLAFAGFDIAALAVTVNAIGRKRAASARARMRGAEYPAGV
jgi:hypothetical protein